MKLKKGIFVHSLLPDGYDSLKINSGTVFHTEQRTDAISFNGLHFTPQYAEDAYVVKRDWANLSHRDKQILQPGTDRNSHNTIYVGEIPETLKRQFLGLELENSTSKEEVLARFNSHPDNTRDLSTALSNFLTPLSGSKAFQFRCISTNYPNTEMVAYNATNLPENYKPEDVRYIGMHNDGASGMTLHTAYKFNNRININLGKNDRSLLFVNLSMLQAINMLKKIPGITPGDIHIASVPALFFEHFPDYPVISIRQKPYQFYIAPTFNCFHDGSTRNSTALDITITYFGFFKC